MSVEQLALDLAEHHSLTIQEAIDRLAAAIRLPDPEDWNAVPLRARRWRDVLVTLPGPDGLPVL